jgi:Na+/H+-translocating membrane pyrophosphatase
MEAINYTESQRLALERAMDSAYRSGVWMGVFISVGGLIGITIITFVLNKYGPEVYELLANL